MKIGWTGAVLVLAAALMGCAGGPAPDAGPVIVAATDVLADLTRSLAGPGVDVDVLTPGGAEAHDLELGPDEVELVLDADLVVYASAGFQPALERALERRDGPTVDVAAGHDDPHVWLDPVAMLPVLASISDALADVLSPPPPPDLLLETANALTALDRGFTRAFASCGTRTFVVAHAAFGHLAERYDLRQVALGFSPEQETDPAALDRVIDVVRAEGITTIFSEPYAAINPMATVGRETGTRVEVLDPLEYLTPGGDYRSAMERNREALAEAMRC